MEHDGNLLSRVPGKTVHGKVSHQRHSTTKLSEGCTRGSCWPLGAAGHYVLQDPANRAHGNQEARPFLPAMSPQLPTDKTLIVPAGKEKVVKGPRSIFTEQAKRMNFFPRGNK